jgi:imidazole glycerol-phosphate synthase subunit HisH
MIGIIDYGVGNLRAFVNSYKTLHIQLKLVQKNEDFEGVDRIILPGVGAFDDAMLRLQHSGMYDTINDLVLNKKYPVIGICVGMQMLTKSSEEGKLPGLGWVDAEVKKFDVNQLGKHLPLPHMGWNNVATTTTHPILNGLEKEAKFYFLHSYYVAPALQEDIIATTEYGFKFASMIRHENIYGIQCHPEKSHQFGLQLLKNFAELPC